METKRAKMLGTIFIAVGDTTENTENVFCDTNFLEEDISVPFIQNV